MMIFNLFCKTDKLKTDCTASPNGKVNSKYLRPYDRETWGNKGLAAKNLFFVRNILDLPPWGKLI